MAIYNRWGEIEIIAYCGKHHSDYHRTEMTLLKVRWHDSLETEKEFYCFAEFMKADDGWNEIRRTMYKVPELKLSAEKLKEAMIRAR